MRLSTHKAHIILCILKYFSKTYYVKENVTIICITLVKRHNWIIVVRKNDICKKTSSSNLLFRLSNKNENMSQLIKVSRFYFFSIYEIRLLERTPYPTVFNIYVLPYRDPIKESEDNWLVGNLLICFT